MRKNKFHIDSFLHRWDRFSSVQNMLMCFSEYVFQIKILIITYLKEYVKTKFNKDIVSDALIIPSNENTSREEVSTEMLLFISKINSEKQIFL